MDADVRERLEAADALEILVVYYAGEDAERALELEAAIKPLLTQPLAGREVVPGRRRCAKCGLVAVYQDLNTADGSVTLADHPEPCINGCGPTWPITEREARIEAETRLSLLSPGAPEGWRERLFGEIYLAAVRITGDQPQANNIATDTLAALTSSSSDQQDFRVSRDHAPSTCAALEEVSHALEACEGEQEHFESWAAKRGYAMHEHPLHYIFMDEKTNAARMGWKAGVAWAQSLVQAALSSQTEVPGEGSRDGPITTPSSSSEEEREAESFHRRLQRLVAEKDYPAALALLRSPAPSTPKGEGEDGGDARYVELGRACERHGLAWFREDGEMLFQAPADVIEEQTAESLTAEIQRLREALTMAAKRFRHYERLHQEKGTTEGCAKAQSNADMAEVCENALAGRAPVPNSARSALGDDQGGAS